MRIEEHFTVGASVGDVWAFLTDPERVAAALPGAEISEEIDERTYAGGMVVKVGPLAAAYTGTVSFALDEEERSAVVRARGQGKGGMGTADMTMTSRVSALSAAETEITVEAELTVTGILVQLGRGMIQVVSKKMFEEFTANLTNALTSHVQEDEP